MAISPTLAAQTERLKKEIEEDEHLSQEQKDIIITTADNCLLGTNGLSTREKLDNHGISIFHTYMMVARNYKTLVELKDKLMARDTEANARYDAMIESNGQTRKFLEELLTKLKPQGETESISLPVGIGKHVKVNGHGAVKKVMQVLLWLGLFAMLLLFIYKETH